MPHALKKGTALDIEREDYAYTRDLDLTGWAWEFLRRHAPYGADYLSNHRIPQSSFFHESGARIYQLRTQVTASENWGLLQFAEPEKSALELNLFWRPELITHVARCRARPVIDGTIETVSLQMFKARCGVLLSNGREHVAVRGRKRFACLEIVDGSILRGESELTFFHEGFGSVSRHHETLCILRQLMKTQSVETVDSIASTSKYLHYLIALDGHLAGQSYREIAQVLYGAEVVGDFWTGDTRGYKSRARRAVEQGLALMNGGYRALLYGCRKQPMPSSTLPQSKQTHDTPSIAMTMQE